MFAYSIYRRLKPFPKKLCIYTSIGHALIVSSVYKDFPVQVNDVVMTVDLIPIDLQEFDTIRGKDFLFKFYALMDCHIREVVFKRPVEAQVIFQEDKEKVSVCVIYDVKWTPKRPKL